MMILFYFFKRLVIGVGLFCHPSHTCVFSRPPFLFFISTQRRKCQPHCSGRLPPAAAWRSRCAAPFSASTATTHAASAFGKRATRAPAPRAKVRPTPGALQRRRASVCPLGTRRPLSTRELALRRCTGNRSKNGDNYFKFAILEFAYATNTCQRRQEVQLRGTKQSGCEALSYCLLFK